MLTVFAAAAVLCMAVPAAAETFTAENGVLSIDLPNENWKEMQDPAKWIALSDGANVMTVQHLSNGEELPAMTIADDHYVNVYQAVYSTQNEVFIITGSIVDAAKTEEIVNMIMSAKVLKYDTKLAVKKATPKANEFTIVPMDQTMYVATDGLNVRMGCSTDEQVIGGLAYGASVKVTGKIQRNGADYGWYQIAYNSGSGYVSAQFLSAEAPAAKEQASETSLQFTGNAKTLYEIDGHAVTVYEATDGFWYDAAGMKYTRTTEYEFIAANGAGLSVNKPVTGGEIIAVADAVEVYWLNGNATLLTPYSDGYYYTEDWVRYSASEDGMSYVGADGSILYVFPPQLSTD